MHDKSDRNRKKIVESESPNSEFRIEWNPKIKRKNTYN